LTVVPTCAGDGLFDVVSDLERERDALRLEGSALRGERDAAREQVSSLRSERDALLLERDAAAKERDALLMEIRQLSLRLELTGEELRESEERCADLAAQVFTYYRYAIIHKWNEPSSSFLDLCADLAARRFHRV
jgi:chromosome segregation ATPase